MVSLIYQVGCCAFGIREAKVVNLTELWSDQVRGRKIDLRSSGAVPTVSKIWSILENVL